MPDNDWHKKLEKFLRKKTWPPRSSREALHLVRQCIEVHGSANKIVLDDIMATIEAAFRRYGLVIARRPGSAEPPKRPAPPLIGSVTRVVPEVRYAGEDEHSQALRFRYAPPRWQPPTPPSKRPPPVEGRR